MPTNDSEKPLYKDFNLTEENCDKEPIHRPLAIQGHGQMLVFDGYDYKKLIAASEGLISFFELDEQQIWGSNGVGCLPPEFKDILAINESNVSTRLIDPIPFDWKTQRFNVIKHQYNGKSIVEIEPTSDDPLWAMSTSLTVRTVDLALQDKSTIEDIYQAFAESFKAVVGYDRVMVYQFDKDGHGHVVGEARESHLEPYLGLHYPESDIPKMARDLFLLNKSRIIPDIHTVPQWLKFSPHTNQASLHLDLSLSQLRAISPIHIQYLNNMGVVGTLTIALIWENQLWGLVACHHYSPYFVPFDGRKVCEILANNLIYRIKELEQKLYNEKNQEIQQKEASFIENIDVFSDIGAQLVHKQADLRHFCKADGFAVVTQDAGMFTKGLTPPGSTLSEIKEWLLQYNEPGKDYYETDHMQAELPGDIHVPDNIGGLLATFIDSDGGACLMWFKKTQKHQFVWGGDPNKPYELEQLAEGGIRLNPRKSFAKWQETVDTKSSPWEKHSIDSAYRLRNVLLERSNQRKAAKAKLLEEDLEQLVYVASHDLQEPLRTITNYLSLIQEELEETKNPEHLHYISRTVSSAGRMKSLIENLLFYSRIGRNMQKEWVSLGKVLEEVQEALGQAIKESNTSITLINTRVSINWDINELKQLYQNLVSNAIKYRKESDYPKIDIEVHHMSGHWLLSVHDNGIGIAPKYFDQVFSLFKRLHRKDEYDGVGIGLAYCKKIVESMDGKIWVTSKPGEGSTFWISLQEPLVQYDEKTSRPNLTH